MSSQSGKYEFRLCESKSLFGDYHEMAVARYYAPKGGHLRLTAAAESTENLWYLCTVLTNVYVASTDPDHNHRGRGQLPNPKSAILR